jgi:hypothetical protein
MTPLPKASALDKILGYASTGAGILGAIPGIGGATTAGAALAPGATAANASMGSPGMGSGTQGMPVGMGDAAPSSTWFSPLDQAKQQQNNPGSASSYLPNPFSDYGSSGVYDPVTAMLQGLARAYKR